MKPHQKGELRNRIIEWRRQLHKIPEPAFREYRTAEYVESTLKGLGIATESGIAGTGVVGTLDTGRPGPTVMLRADMDALPIDEQGGGTFRSEHPGFMHACGHDGHMAMVLGAAASLVAGVADLVGTVRFLFQPAEEGPGGAQPMIRAGVMGDSGVDNVFGCHIWPQLPRGVIGIKSGPLMASMGRFDVTVNGKGGHAGMPHLAVDALDTSVQVVNALQRVVSRQNDPLVPTVLSVGELRAGTSFNIIADHAELSGTVRTFDSDLWEQWPERLGTVINDTCSAMGAESILDYEPGYPVLVNDVDAASLVRNAAFSVCGESRVVEPVPTMGSEDFAFFLREAPGCFFFLGCGEDHRAGLHHRDFSFDEDILSTGTEIYVRTVRSILALSPEAGT